MIYYKCSSDEIMRSSEDIENPNKRFVPGLKLVTKQEYQDDNVWKIYDPNSGHTFEARIHLTVPKYGSCPWLEIIVREEQDQ